jgi:hypothetical protein
MENLENCEECEEEECEEEESESMTNDDWLIKQKTNLKNIKKFKLAEDRFLSTAQLSYMHKTLCESVTSWNDWVDGWMAIEFSKKLKVNDEEVVTLTEEELKDIHEKYRDLAIKFIELDIAITESFTKKLNDAVKKQSAPTVKPEHKGMVV